MERILYLALISGVADALLPEGRLQNGVRAAYLNSSLTSRQYALALDNARRGVYRIIYVAPERLLTESFLDFAMHAPIAQVVVDEEQATCAPVFREHASWTIAGEEGLRKLLRLMGNDELQRRIVQCATGVKGLAAEVAEGVGETILDNGKPLRVEAAWLVQIENRKCPDHRGSYYTTVWRQIEHDCLGDDGARSCRDSGSAELNSLQRGGGHRESRGG